MLQPSGNMDGGTAIALITVVGCCGNCKGCVDCSCWEGCTESCSNRSGMEASTLSGTMAAAALEGVDAACGNNRRGSAGGCGIGATPTDAVAVVDVEAGRIAVGAAAAAAVAAGGCDGGPMPDARVGRPSVGAEEEDDDEEDDEELEDEEEEDLAAPLMTGAAVPMVSATVVVAATASCLGGCCLGARGRRWGAFGTSTVASCSTARGMPLVRGPLRSLLLVSRVPTSSESSAASNSSASRCRLRFFRGRVSSSSSGVAATLLHRVCSTEGS